MRMLVTLIATTLAACSPGSSNGGDGTLTQPPITGLVTPTLEACPTEAACAVDAPHNYISDPAGLEQQLRTVVTAGCQRFLSDCKYLCDSVWYTCAPTLAQCVDDTTKSYLANMDYPVLDPHLTQQCLTDIQQAACTEVPPDTPACELALVEGCPEDHDNLGAPYSWAAAASIPATPSEFTVQLCGGVEEWLRLPLSKGDILTIKAAEDKPSFGFATVDLLRIEPGRDEPEKLADEFIRWGTDDPAAFAAIDTDGEYYLELRATESMTFTLRIDVTQEAPAAP